MTDAIKNIIEDIGLHICPTCEGDGEVAYFCGHYVSVDCHMCDGNGIIMSQKKEKHSKKCDICNGREGGCGGCDSNPNGLIEWESYELWDGDTVAQLHRHEAERSSGEEADTGETFGQTVHRILSAPPAN